MSKSNESTALFAQFPLLQRTVDDTFGLADLVAKLKSGKPLRIKYGVDVTAPLLHIGHAVNLWAMREMQEQGHVVVFLIGDFTTLIGDPTGKSATRPKIDPADIERDAVSFQEQVSEVLLTDPEVFEVRRNSEWWNSLSLSSFLELASKVTHAKLIQRDMFQERIAHNHEIHMHEMLYPILQGYDSHALNSDLTIVGSDQLFNELLGRFYQERLGGKPQTVLTTKITAGIDGRAKQSKSLGNYIGLLDSPRDKFGKAMSLPDHLIEDFLRVYTTVSLAEIAEMMREVHEGKTNPMMAKQVLASALVERYHGKAKAEEETLWFQEVFSNKSQPSDIPTIIVPDPRHSVSEIMALCLPDESRKSLHRLIEQGGVRVNGERKLSDPQQQHALRSGDVLRIGKRKWFRIVFK